MSITDTFKCFVVRYDNKDPENFIPLTAVPRDLFKPETWARNKIKEVHIISYSTGFVAFNADKLRELMLPLASRCSDDIPARLAKRADVEQAATKHRDGGFQEELERHAK